MHVGSARFHTDFAQNCDRSIAHDLVFFVRQRQRRGNGDGITRMHAHGVHVFDGTNDDSVVSFVADNLHFVFFPTQQGFVDQDLVHGRCVHPCAAIIFVIFAVIGDTATCPTQGKGRTDNRRQADFIQRINRQPHAFVQVSLAVFFLGGGDDGCFGVFQTDAIHRFAEQFAIFGHFNGVAFCANHFNAVFVQHAHFLKRERGVQTRLTAHRWQQCVGALFLDDFGNHFWCDGFDIGGIRQTRVCHNRRWVGIDQHHAIPLFSQRFTRLGARIIEFTGLANNDRTCADNHD